jgi:hypothetical protein
MQLEAMLQLEDLKMTLDPGDMVGAELFKASLAKPAAFL